MLFEGSHKEIFDDQKAKTTKAWTDRKTTSGTPRDAAAGKSEVEVFQSLRSPSPPGRDGKVSTAV